MVSREVFIDTSGWFAFLIKQDSAHQDSVAIFRQCFKTGRTLITTDFVLDETATLFKSRGHGHFCESFFDTIFRSEGIRMEWIDEERFIRSRDFFLKHEDHAFSFTDCSSFVVMRELEIHEVLTKDKDFQEAKFKVLLA